MLAPYGYLYRCPWLGVALTTIGCSGGYFGSDSSLERAPDAGAGDIDSVLCGETVCQSGFVCEFDTCVSEVPPIPPTSGEPRDPLTSDRYVFSLDPAHRRLVRIDSLTLSATAYAAGLLPMDLAVLGDREITLLLDGYDLLEVIDHRHSPPLRAGFTTARRLSHLVPSPTGLHAVAYYDWDDPRAQQRQPEPGNINKVSVFYAGDGDAPFADADARIVDVSVGFLPRDVRFSSDGSRAVVISESVLTPIDLVSEVGVVAEVAPQVAIAADAQKILIDTNATLAVVLYPDAQRVDIVNLQDGATDCLETAGAVSDIAFRDADTLAVLWQDDTQVLSFVDVGAATTDCTALTAQIAVGEASRLAIDPGGERAIAYKPALDIKTLWQVSLTGASATPRALEKAIAAVAFVGDGRFALVSHLKAPGTPAWDPSVESPEESVDKSYGSSWLDMHSGAHHLTVSKEPLGAFVFVPATDDAPSATYLSVLDAKAPQLLRISHALGFQERWIDLAAMPLRLGFLPETAKAFATQEHPWGRITFMDPEGIELRHVTGFALELP